MTFSSARHADFLIAIMTFRHDPVLILGGIDLSVGPVMGLVAIVTGLLLTWHQPWYSRSPPAWRREQP